MTANEPPNPYTPPSAALADGGPDATAAPRVRAPSRLTAAAVTILAYPLIGAGLYLRGRPRRFRGWAIAGGLLLATLIVAVRLPQPRLGVFAIYGAWLTLVMALADTVYVRPGDGRLVGKAWVLALAFIVAGKGGGLAIRYWLAEPLQMPSGSMVPTLFVGDHMFVKKGRGDIARGDVIVFKSPQDTRTDYIKRVIAVGGDTIEVTGGVVSINGAPLEQTELEGDCPEQEEPGWCKLARETSAGRSYTIMLMPGHPAMDHPRTVIPEGEVFVMGDNRDNSYDSRKWGTVKADLIKGKATVVWWSKAPNGPARWSRIGRGIE